MVRVESVISIVNIFSAILAKYLIQDCEYIASGPTRYRFRMPTEELPLVLREPDHHFKLRFTHFVLRQVQRRCLWNPHAVNDTTKRTPGEILVGMEVARQNVLNRQQAVWINFEELGRVTDLQKVEVRLRNSDRLGLLLRTPGIERGQ